QLSRNKFPAPSCAGSTDSARLGILVAMLFFSTAPFLYRTAIAFIFALSGSLLFLALIRLLLSKNQVMVPLMGVMFG
ncbi:iron chelate uptake ABC transporter family permease subunit, partial [Enterococcus faecalis]|uniref:iron chelate uptake ABC transporter family permease subunit n=1 Tax=Enterococcus faecalis TaxID=1351 RepID=UPI003D6AC06B